MLLSNQPPASKQASFEVYRYQLVVDKMLQQGMFQDYQTADEIRNNKNKILQALASLKAKVHQAMAIPVTTLIGQAQLLIHQAVEEVINNSKLLHGV